MLASRTAESGATRAEEVEVLGVTEDEAAGMGKVDGGTEDLPASWVSSFASSRETCWVEEGMVGRTGRWGRRLGSRPPAARNTAVTQSHNLVRARDELIARATQASRLDCHLFHPCVSTPSLIFLRQRG